LFFDEASRNNPRVVVVGGSLFDLGGNIKTFYSWGLGSASNDIVEAYALFQGLKLAIEKKINKLTVFRDSMIVANVVIHRTQMGTNPFNGIINRVIELSKEFEAFQLYHMK